MAKVKQHYLTETHMRDSTTQVATTVQYLCLNLALSIVITDQNSIMLTKQMFI